jgi:hypothetical protein
VLRLNLSGKVPAGAAAAVINLTVTDPRKSGHLTAYPDGTHAPNASDLNFSAGETVPNLVTVPLTNDIADIANASPGTVQMVADLEGYFSSRAPDSFVPISPTRELDTRTTGSALAADRAITMNILTDAGKTAVAMVDNVTVTAPAKDGNLIVYPAGPVAPDRLEPELHGQRDRAQPRHRQGRDESAGLVLQQQSREDPAHRR